MADHLVTLGIPVVFHTGYAWADLPVRFLGTPVFEKSCEPADLMDGLRCLTERRLERNATDEEPGFGPFR